MKKGFSSILLFILFASLSILAQAQTSEIRIVPGPISSLNREQIITVLGQNLPKNLVLISDQCESIVSSFQSETEQRFLCALKKVATQDIRVIDPVSKLELGRNTTDILEVYGITGSKSSPLEVSVEISGVHLDKGVSFSSTACSLQITEKTSAKAHGRCTLENPIERLPLFISTKDGVILFDDSIQIHLGSGSSNLIDTKLLKINCADTTTDSLMLGECDVSSDFLRKASVIASLEKSKDLYTKAVLDGTFEGSLHTAVDSYLKSNVAGLRLNPASGSGLIIFDPVDQSLLMNGELKAVGFDVSELLHFPFVFDLYDFQGEWALSYPSFDITKTRTSSKVVFGMGDLKNKQITLLKQYRNDLREKIRNFVADANVALQKSKIEIGAKLIGSIGNSTLKKIARKTYIKVLKGLEIVPEIVAFYDNFDLEAIGILKSDPFKPTNWTDKPWIAEANLAKIDLDFSAKKAELNLKGDILNSLSILNNNVLKTDRGLINAGLKINLNKDDGILALTPVEVKLPNDLAKAKAEVYFSHLFKPSELTAAGRITSGIKLAGVDLIQSGAAFHFDPNKKYRLGNEVTEGLLQFGAKTKLVAVAADGRMVFTHPDHQLAMDFGGKLNLDFLGYQKFLGDALGRGRWKSDGLSLCFNSESGRFEFKSPVQIFSWGIINNNPIVIQGDVSIDTAIGTTGLLPSLTLLNLSGQGSDEARVGFSLDRSQSFFGAITEHTEKCTDAPKKSFLKDVLKIPSMASREKSLAAEVSEDEKIVLSDTFHSSSLQWDVSGWKVLTPLSNTLTIVLLDSSGNEVNLATGSFKVPGLWKFENPLYYTIYSSEAFTKAGYRFAVRGGGELGIANYSKTTETRNTFSVPTVAQNQIIDLSLLDQKQITVNGKPLLSGRTDTRSLTAQEMNVEVEVKSDSFDIPPLEIPTIPKSKVTSFRDIRSPILREAVEHLVEKGIMKGYPDGTFRPDRPVMRREAILMIQKSGLKSLQKVPRLGMIKKSEFIGALMTPSEQKSYLSKFKKFKPNESMTRGEAALIIHALTPKISE